MHAFKLVYKYFLLVYNFEFNYIICYVEFLVHIFRWSRVSQWISLQSTLQHLLQNCQPDKDMGWCQSLLWREWRQTGCVWQPRVYILGKAYEKNSLRLGHLHFTTHKVTW